MATMNAHYVSTPHPVPNLEEEQQISRSLLRLRMPVSVSFNDKFGRPFVDTARTELVSAWGATLECSYSLSWGQELRLSFANKEILARTVGQTGVGDRSHSYGVCFLQEDKHFWGVSFPRMAGHREVTLALECCRCGFSRSSAVNDIEKLVLQTNRHLVQSCPVCNDSGYWKVSEATSDMTPGSEIQHVGERIWSKAGESPRPAVDPNLVSVGSMQDADFLRPAPRAERRRHKRVNLPTAKACIERPGSNPDVTDVVNVSRSGACVRSSTFYPMGSWIRIACPYTIGGSNIFQSGRIVRISTFGNVREYGIEYVRLI